MFKLLKSPKMHLCNMTITSSNIMVDPIAQMITDVKIKYCTNLFNRKIIFYVN
jgi:hypothetical protein